MAQSNSIFFRVVAQPPLEGVGFEVQVLHYTDFSTVVAVIPQYISLSFGPELNAPGAGSITLDADMPLWQQDIEQPDGSLVEARAMLNNEYLWQVWDNGTLRFAFLGSNVEENPVADDNTRGITISGPGIAQVLTWAAILPPGFPKPAPVPQAPDPNYDFSKSVSYNNDRAALNWQFPPTWPAMQMWHTLLAASQSRGTTSWVKPTFTATHDSAGSRWEYVPTISTAAGQGFSPDLGTNLLDFLNTCTGQDYSDHFAERAEWFMHPDFKLEARKWITSNTASTYRVVFWEGELVSKQRTRTRDAIANYICVLDEIGNFSLGTDAVSQRTWNRRESVQNKNSQVTDAIRRNALAGIYIDQFKDEKSEWVIQVPYNRPGRRPFIDFTIGDWIGISNFKADTSSTVDAFRVQAITVTVQDDEPALELTLQSKMDFYLHQLDARISDIINQVTNITNANNGGAGGATPPGYTPTNPPGTPGGPDVPPDYPNEFCNSCVWIQDTDPGDKAKPGDFWYNTAYVPPVGPTPGAAVTAPSSTGGFSIIPDPVWTGGGGTTTTSDGDLSDVTDAYLHYFGPDEPIPRPGGTA